MAGLQLDQGSDELGPVDLLVVEFPSGVTGGEGFEVLLELVDSRVVYVIDLEFVERSNDGEVRVVELSALPNPNGLDLSPLDGSATSLLDADDIATVGQSIQPGGIAAILVYENLFAERLTAAFGRSGGRIVARNSVSVEDLSTALDHAEGVDHE